MTKDEYDEKLEYTPEDEKESIAAKAVTEALTAVREKVLKKHKLRKDSWHRTTSVFTMSELVHNKMHRLKELYQQNSIVRNAVLKEINDELDDIIAYAAFQRYVLNVDQLMHIHDVPESDGNV